jgi:hypothetical protein
MTQKLNQADSTIVFGSESFAGFDGLAAQSIPMKNIVRALTGSIAGPVLYADRFDFPWQKEFDVACRGVPHRPCPCCK